MRLTLKESICQAGRLTSNDAIIAGRAQLLAPVDRDLAMAVLVRGETAEGFSRIMNVSPKTVRSRVRKLARRMASRKFIFTARVLRYLPKQEAMLAKLRFCQGLSQREMCRRMRLTSYAVRRRLDRLAAQMETIRRISLSCRDDLELQKELELPTAKPEGFVPVVVSPAGERAMSLAGA